MILHITKVEHIVDYKVAVSFNNGESGVADLSSIVNKGVFQRLQSPKAFAQVTVDEELETIAWPGGLDLAPEYVYFQAFKHDATQQSQFNAWGYAD